MRWWTTAEFAPALFKQVMGVSNQGVLPQGILIMCRPSYPPLTRLSHEACPRPRSGSGNPSRRSPVFPTKRVPDPDRGAGIHPAAHPSFPRSLSPAPIGERESIPPLTRLSHETCPRPRSGSGNLSRRSPVFPTKRVPDTDRRAGIHPAAHPSFPRKRESMRS